MALPARLSPNVKKPKARLRSDAHRAWVRDHRCCVPGCQLMPIECAHVSRSWSGGIGMKSSDAMTISLCREHHAESHRIGEQSFNAKHGIIMMNLAREFYLSSPHRSKLDNPFS
jgi:hypothetical protein